MDFWEDFHAAKVINLILTHLPGIIQQKRY